MQGLWTPTPTPLFVSVVEWQSLRRIDIASIRFRSIHIVIKTVQQSLPALGAACAYRPRGRDTGADLPTTLLEPIVDFATLPLA